jgi:prepilin signal peptidase PulO-like enzyme (type II secretory pathway)
LENYFLIIVSAVFGILVGSFLNALIYRLPREINIALPRSHCPNCNKLIYWYENIPIISFLVLRGKCSGCHTKISWQYPLIELVCGIVAALIAPHTLEIGNIFSFVFYFSVFSCFLVHFIVDLKHQILPDAINLYLGILFFVVSLINYNYLHWGLGLLIGFGFPYIVSYLFQKLRGQVGLGGGDIKLWAALGIYLGPMGIIHNIFLSCFIGALFGGVLLITKVIKKENPIPFGPFIIIVATFQIFFEKTFHTLIRYIS